LVRVDPFDEWMLAEQGRGVAMSGLALVRVPHHGRAFIPLTEARRLPVGTVVDARGGGCS